jgi:hypothetical protein
MCSLSVPTTLHWNGNSIYAGSVWIGYIRQKRDSLLWAAVLMTGDGNGNSVCEPTAEGAAHAALEQAATEALKAVKGSTNV